MWHDWLSIGGYLIGNCAKQILEILEILEFRFWSSPVKLPHQSIMSKFIARS